MQRGVVYCYVKMHLKEEPTFNLTLAELWTSLSDERRDNRTDDLPLMDSIAWPLGKHSHQKFIPTGYTNFISGIGFLDILMALNSGSYKWRWWYPHVFSSTNNCKKVWNCLVFLFSLTQSFMCILNLCVEFYCLFWSTGKRKV